MSYSFHCFSPINNTGAPPAHHRTGRHTTPKSRPSPPHHKPSSHKPYGCLEPFFSRSPERRRIPPPVRAFKRPVAIPPAPRVVRPPELFVAVGLSPRFIVSSAVPSCPAPASLRRLRRPPAGAATGIPITSQPPSLHSVVAVRYPRDLRAPDKRYRRRRRDPTNYLVRLRITGK